jgi:hypothetical protein
MFGKLSVYLLLLLLSALSGCGGSGSGGSDSGGPGSDIQSAATALWMLGLSDTQASHGAPQMSFNAGGDGIAVCSVTSGTEAKLLYAGYAAASDSWSAEQVLSGSVVGTVSHLQVASNGADFIAAWSWTDARGHGGVDAAIYSNGAWATPISLGDVVDSITVSTLAIASNGSGFAVVWDVYTGAVKNIYGAVFDGSAWQSTSQLDAATSGFSSTPVIASNGSGYAVVWNQQSSVGSAYGIYSRVYSSGAWGSQRMFTVPANTAAAYLPSIASNGQGYVTAWFQGNDVGAVIYSGNSWGSVMAIDNLSASAYGVRAVASGSNYAVGWYQAESGIQQVFTNIYDNGSGVWQGSVKLSMATSTGSAYAPVMAANGNGFAALWLQSDGTETRIMTSVYTDPVWSMGEYLSDAGQTLGRINLTATAGGYAAFWVDSNNSVYADIYSSGLWGGSSRIDGDESGTIATDLYFPYATSGDIVYFAWQLSSDSDVSPRLNVYKPAGGWGTAFNMVSGSYHGSARVVKLLRAADGGRAAIWIQYDHGNSSLYASVFVNDSWSTPVKLGEKLLNSINFGYDIVPYGAAAGTGFAASWAAGDGTNNNIYAAVYQNGAWSTATVLDNAGSEVPRPRIAAAGDGYAVTWSRIVNGKGNIYVSLYKNGTWNVATGVDAPTNHSYYPNVVSNGSDYLVAWYQNTGSNSYSDLYASVYDGMQWSSAAAVDEAANTNDIGVNFGMFQLTSNGSGYALAWYQPTTSSGEQRLFAAIYNGAAWGAVTEVDDSGINHPANNARIVSSGGGYALSWDQQNDSDGGFENIYASVYTGGTWSAAAALDDPNLGAAAEKPRIAGDGSGYMVAWKQSNGGDNSVFTARYDGAWGAVTLVDDVVGNGTAYDPEIASNGTSYTLSWAQDSGGVAKVYAKRYGNGAWGQAYILSDATVSGDAGDPIIIPDGDKYLAAWTQAAKSGDPIVRHVWASRDFASDATSSALH